MKRLLVFLILCLIPCWLGIETAQADMLYLKNGDEYKGSLEEMTPDSIFFLIDETNEIEEFPRTELLRIELSKKRVGTDVTTLKELNDSLLNSVIKSAPDAAEYPDAGYLTLYEEVRIRVHPDQSYTQTKRIIRKVLQQHGMRMATNSISYLAHDETVTIDFARTIDPQGNLYHIEDNAIEDGSVYARIPEYENLHRLKFALPEVKVGTVMDYQISRRKEKISALVPFLIAEYLRYTEPLLKKVVTITVPKDLPLAAAVIRPNERIAHSTEAKGNTIIYTWTVTQAPRVKEEPNMPPYSDILPKLVAGLQTTEIEMGQAYVKVLDENFKPSGALRAKVNELVKHYTEPEKRVRILYNYVAREIGYIGVAPQSFSYLPKSLDRIFNNKFGNSLDKAYLLYGMLKMAGLKPAFLWVRSQAQGELVKEVLSLGQFTTPLVVLEINDEFKYLYPARDTIPFGILPAKYQGVYGLLIKSEGFQQMIKTPLYPPEQEARQNTFEITISTNGDLTVKKSIDLSGGYEIAERGHKDLKSEELSQAFQQRVNQIHPNARLVDYHISNLKDLDKKIELTLTYQINDYAIKAGEELLVFRLPEINYSAAAVGRETREFPIDWDTRDLLVNKVTITIPEGYQVYYLPKHYSYEVPSVMSYQSQIEVKQQEIIFRDQYRREITSLTADKYPDYKKCLETMATLAKEWIILAKE